MDDKRTVTREKFQNYLSIIDTASFESLGFLQDVSQKGIRIKSHVKLSSQKRFTLAIKLSSKINNTDNIVLTATCVWSKPENESYINGFIIDNISEDNFIILQKLIDDFTSCK